MPANRVAAKTLAKEFIWTQVTQEPQMISWKSSSENKGTWAACPDLRLRRRGARSDRRHLRGTHQGVTGTCTACCCYPRRPACRRRRRHSPSTSRCRRCCDCCWTWRLGSGTWRRRRGRPRRRPAPAVGSARAYPTCPGVAALLAAPAAILLVDLAAPLLPLLEILARRRRRRRGGSRKPAPAPAPARGAWRRRETRLADSARR